MLRAIFSTAGGASHTAGVYSELRFDRGLIRPSAAASAIAEHRDHAWFVGATRYLKLDCEGSVMVHLADAQGTLGQTWGPFQCLSSVNGVLSVDGRKFAAFDAAKHIWTIEPSGLQCPTLVARSVVP